MTPREYLNDVVEPNIAEFQAEFGSKRRAMSAIHSLDALAAYIYHAIGGSQGTGLQDDSSYRDQLAQLNTDFALIRDVAKAIKHVELHRGKPLVSRSDQLGSEALGWGEGAYGEGRWGGPVQAYVETNDGDHRILETILVHATDFLKSQMTTYAL